MAHLHFLTRAALLLALLLAPAARALEVSPLRVSLAAGQQDAELWLHNDSAQPWSGQARLYRWEQSEGGEMLTPAKDVVLSPGRLALKAHARQRVRVVRLGPVPSAEQGYRLVIRAGADSPPLQVSLPVFLAGPEARTGPALTARLLEQAGGAVLELHNGGSGHARLADLAYVDSGGAERVILPDLAGYVLAGRTRHWPLPGPASAYAGGRFRARLGDSAAGELPPPALPIASGTP